MSPSLCILQDLTQKQNALAVQMEQFVFCIKKNVSDIRDDFRCPLALIKTRKYGNQFSIDIYRQQHTVRAAKIVLFSASC